MCINKREIHWFHIYADTAPKIYVSRASSSISVRAGSLESRRMLVYIINQSHVYIVACYRLMHAIAFCRQILCHTPLLQPLPTALVFSPYFTNMSCECDVSVRTNS